MLSDEMTTGSVTSADRDKRVLATRSHDWNRKQKRFQDAFPEVRSAPLCVVPLYEPFLMPLPFQYCAEQMKDLPNMGERDRGVPDTITPPPVAPSTASLSSTTTHPASTLQPPLPTSSTTVQRVNNSLNSGAARALQVPARSGSGSGAAPHSPAAHGQPLVPAPGVPHRAPATGWGASWRDALWAKWRWGILIVLAISVSRLSSL